jgi:hypothetical protein
MMQNSNCGNETIDIGSRRELFVDKLIVDKLQNVEFYLHQPQKLPLSKSPLVGKYGTIIKDGGLFRAYYRELDPNYDGALYSGNPGELSCYAESNDGEEWTFPDLGFYKIKGMKHNNVFMKQIPFSHNFCPFLDTRPGIDDSERFKALAGHPGHEREVHADGLHSFVSSDGIHWRQSSKYPVISYDKSWIHAFDSQNVAFWSEAEQQYVTYFRTYLPVQETSEATKTEARYLRSISRSTSPDFKNWSMPVAMKPNLPEEELYTSQTQPYFRAPHIYIALPTRFMKDRGSSTDILFMSSRAGATSYDRLFAEAFIKPGLSMDRWGNRSNYVALNVVPTGEDEMSIYHANSGYRYVLRLDGFVSIKSGSAEGTLVTKTLIFSGSKLSLNVSTSAAGCLQVEIQDEDGVPLSGFSLDECSKVIGDKISYEVEWIDNKKLAMLAGRPVRLKFVMKECDLYSFKFDN